MFTVHNLAYQGLFPMHDWAMLKLASRFMSPTGLEYHGQLSFMKAGLRFADRDVYKRQQYKSHSLLRHLQRGWAFLKSEMNEFVDLLPAQQRVDEESWYRGTADAVFQNQDILAAYGAEYVVVLAGDHIYKQNYACLLYTSRCV